MIERLKSIIQEVLECEDKKLENLSGKTHLRNDLDFDSLKLAQLTVEIEDEFDIDIFEDGIVETIQDIINKIDGE